MSELNPYAPPETDVLPPQSDESKPLATPGTRLGAALIDGIIIAVITMPLAWITGYYSRVQAAAVKGITFLPESLLWSALGIGIVIGINWSALQNGQTIGKRALGIQIQRKDGSRIDPVRIITHRMLPVQLVALVPYLGSILVIIDSLLIFRAKRNTLHDDIADTKVIKL